MNKTRDRQMKLVAADLDGTLVNHDDKVGSLTTKNLRSAAKRGVQIALITGRLLHNTTPIAKELGLEVHYVCLERI